MSRKPEKVFFGRIWARSYICPWIHPYIDRSSIRQGRSASAKHFLWVWSQPILLWPLPTYARSISSCLNKSIQSSKPIGKIFFRQNHKIFPIALYQPIRKIFFAKIAISQKKNGWCEKTYRIRIISAKIRAIKKVVSKYLTYQNFAFSLLV